MPATTRTRAPHLGPERRRPQILDAARGIAVREGLAAVNVRSVALALGVTRPVVYACFADRVDMVEALLDRETEEMSAAVLGALHSSGGFDDAEQAFVAGFQALLRSAAANPDPWRLLLLGEPDASLADRFRAVRAQVQQRATEWIGPAMEHWWATEDLDHKLPVLIELFMSSCEAALRCLLANDGTWSTDDLGRFLGRAVHRAFQDA